MAKLIKKAPTQQTHSSNTTIQNRDQSNKSSCWACCCNFFAGRQTPPEETPFSKPKNMGTYYNSEVTTTRTMLLEQDSAPHLGGW